MLREIHSADELLAHLQDGGTVSGLRLQGVDLASAAGEALIALPNRFDGLVVLGVEHVERVARTKLAAAGADPDSWDSMDERTRHTFLAAFFAGVVALFVAAFLAVVLAAVFAGAAFFTPTVGLTAAFLGASNGSGCLDLSTGSGSHA